MWLYLSFIKEFLFAAIYILYLYIKYSKEQTDLPYNTILNSTWFFYFLICKSRINKDIGIKLALKVWHLSDKNGQNRTLTFQGPIYWIWGPQ